MDNTTTEIAKLQQKITALQATNLQQFQKEILANLYQLRSALIEDIENVGTASPASNDTEDQKDKKIAELEAQNKRLNYRILHLTRNLKERLG